MDGTAQTTKPARNGPASPLRGLLLGLLPPGLWMRPGGARWALGWALCLLLLAASALVAVRKERVRQGQELRERHQSLVQRRERLQAQAAERAEKAAARGSAVAPAVPDWRELRRQAEAAGVRVQSIRSEGGGGLDLQAGCSFAAWLLFRRQLRGFRVRHEQLEPRPDGSGLELFGRYEPLLSSNDSSNDREPY